MEGRMAGINYKPGVELGDLVRDQSDILAMLESVLDERVQDEYEPSDILGSPVYGVDHRAGWRFRVREWPMNLDSLMRSDGLTPNKMRNIILGSLFAIEKHLSVQNKNADWRLAAWEIEERTVRRRARSRTERARVASERWNKFSGQNKPDLSEERLIAERRVVVMLAYVDCQKAPEEDTWHERTGQPGGFADGRVPVGVRKQYQQAVDMLRREHGDGQVGKGGWTADDLRDMGGMRERGVSWRSIGRWASERQGREVTWTEVRELLSGDGGAE